MNRTIARLRGRATLAAFLTAGRLSGFLIRGKKCSVDRRVVRAGWKAVSDGMHNSNTDMTFWNGRFYLCHQTSPFHLGTSRSRMKLWASTDAHDWKLVRQFKADDGEFRDPTFAQIHGRLFIYFLPNRDRNPEPYTTAFTWSKDGADWSPVEEVDHPGWLYWRPKTRDNETWYVTAYWHEHGQSRLLKTNDGVSWQTVSQIWEGERNDETDFEFLPDGRILSTARLEGKGSWDGDRLGATLLSVAEPPYTDWAHDRSHVTRLDGPCLFPYNGRVYAVGRHQASFLPGLVEQGGLFAKKRTSLYHVEPTQLTYLTDLPSGGDTSYAGIVIRDSDMYVSYYTSAVKQDPVWVNGMFQPSDIRMARVSLPALERLADSKR